MTRIIQRCFLVLTFTGVLLSSARETTISEVSDSTPQSSGTSPSAPENSFTSVGTTSFYSSTDEAKDADTSSTEAAASSSNPVFTSDVTETYSKMTDSSDAGRASEGVSTTTLESEAKGNNDEVHGSSSQTTSLPSTSHSGKSEKEDSESTITENPEKAEFSNIGSNSSKADVKNASSKVSETTISVVSETKEEKETTEVAAMRSSEVIPSENPSSDSEQSLTTVPSKEELIYKSSSVDTSPEETFSTIPSKVQTEGSETSDAKSATRKRSLNGTNAIASSTTMLSPEETSSSAPVAVPLSRIITRAEIAAKEDVNISTDFSPKIQVTVSSDALTHVNYAAVEKEESANPTHEVMEAEVTSFPQPINSVGPDMGVSAVHFIESEYVPDLVSPGYLQDTHMLPISSAALSTLREESIQPSESIDSTAQILNVGHGLFTTSSIPQRSSELETEYSDSIRHSHSSVSPVTFDPNGMTHKFSQDPDSITFLPFEIVHEEGMHTDGYLSRLENGESFSHKPELVTDHFSKVYATDISGSSSHEMEGIDSTERERKEVSSSYDMLPHDEPDKEISSIHFAPSTEQPAISLLSTGGSTTAGTPETSKVVLPLNDESEEMLNDSPHFVQIQSKSTVTPTGETKSKFVNKDLEMNVSNDITHATGSNPRNTPETLHELDFSINYQTDQSEIRPVTVASPLKTSESITVLPDSVKVESQPPSEVTKPGQPDAISPDTSSPIILPNPAPSVVNQSAEATTVVLQPEILPQSNKSDLGSEQENDATVATNSTIAGIAVKTSVSVSLPLSKTPNVSVNSTMEPTRDDANVFSNISGIILPLPIPINKDADGHPPPTISSTEAPAPSTTVSRGLRIRKPKIKINGEDSNDEPATPRTRKPFLAPPQRSSTTAGPPVSIFNKARTRGASITSSTTARPFPQFSTIRIHYASRMPGMVPGGELVFSIEPMTTTVPTTTETEEPFNDEPFTELTQGPIVPTEDDVTLIKVAGCIGLDKGLRWNDLLNNRQSPLYKERSKFVQMQLDRLFRTSPIASQLWKIQIDGFSGRRNSNSVVVDFFLYLIKTSNEVSTEQLTAVFHDKLINSTFSRFTVDTNKTAFEFLNEEPMIPTTEAPEKEPEPVIPQWAIAVIVVGAASLIFIVLFAAVAILGRHHVRRRYSNKLNDEDSDRPSDWESKMAAAYENLAADTIYDAEDLHSDSYKKSYLVD